MLWLFDTVTGSGHSGGPPPWHVCERCDDDDELSEAWPTGCGEGAELAEH
jgi:hypothetical protein